MFRNITPVVKNLLIINVAVFIAQMMLKSIDFTGIMSLWNIGSPNFAPYQFFTYMFAHSPRGFSHVLFNMLGLVFLGPLLERFWGSQKFLIFYMVTGIGAGMLYSGINYFQNTRMESAVERYVNNPDPDSFNRLIIKTFDRQVTQYVFDVIDDYSKNPDNKKLEEQSIYIAEELMKANINLGSMLGASGAVYGILMAFGLLFPNTQLMLLFPPIPVKAKYMVLFLGAYALYAGFAQNPNDQTAHFAHLGGMVFAFIMIQIWKQDRGNFY
ncbi:MAG: rhomboid family intramembrane serine protease [Cyclobacteriaceae bacterium]|nr:rhomboid family intramembrane serine protease [Cyclobacteriaceae bacterium]